MSSEEVKLPELLGDLVERKGIEECRTIGELTKDGILYVFDGNHGGDRPRRDEFVEEGVPFIRGRDIDKSGNIDFENCDKINEVAYNRIRKGFGRGGDILFTHAGTVGKIVRVPDDAPDFVANPAVTVYRSMKPDVIDQDFLFLYMHSWEFFSQVWSRTGETDIFDYISLRKQRELFVPIPSIELQQALCQPISTIQKLIQLNKNKIEKLEICISAIFRSWFIDFDPVKAKAEGRIPYGMDEETAALFPDSFEDSEIGFIPAGWKVHDLSTLTSKITTGLNPRKNFVLGIGDNFYVTTKNISDGKLTIDESCDRVDSDAILKINRRSKLSRGDILLTGVGSVGQIYMLDEEPHNWNINESVFSLRANHEFVTSQILYQILDSYEFRCYCINYALGSVQIGIRKYDIERFKFAIPPYELMKKISSKLETVMVLFQKKQRKSETLEQIQDALLPRLMSGELEVPLET